jgi:hypothetical protein
MNPWKQAREILYGGERKSVQAGLNLDANQIPDRQRQKHNAEDQINLKHMSQPERHTVLCQRKVFKTFLYETETLLEIIFPSN